jgi:hypothetical protein
MVDVRRRYKNLPFSSKQNQASTGSIPSLHIFQAGIQSASQQNSILAEQERAE